MDERREPIPLVVFQVPPVGEIRPNKPNRSPKFPFGGEFSGNDKKKNDVSC